MGETTKVIRCGCSSDYQDKKYGMKNRLHNQARDGWTCTVCGKKKTAV